MCLHHAVSHAIPLAPITRIPDQSHPHVMGSNFGNHRCRVIAGSIVHHDQLYVPLLCGGIGQNFLQGSCYALTFVISGDYDAIAGSLKPVGLRIYACHRPSDGKWFHAGCSGFREAGTSAGDLNPLIQHGKKFANHFLVPQSGVRFFQHGFRRLFVGQGGLIWPGRAQSVGIDVLPPVALWLAREFHGPAGGRDSRYRSSVRGDGG